LVEKHILTLFLCISGRLKTFEGGGSKSNVSARCHLSRMRIMNHTRCIR